MDTFEKELSDAFAEMMLSGQPQDTTSNVQPPTRSSTRPIDPEGAAVPSGKPTPTSTRTETLAAEVNDILRSLRSTVSSGDLNAVVEPMVSIFGKLMDMVPFSLQLPAAVTPDSLRRRLQGDGGEDASPPGLYDGKLCSLVTIKDGAENVMRSFRTMDAIQECREDYFLLRSAPSPPLPGTSLSASFMPANNGLSLAASMRDKLSDRLGSDWASTVMSITEPNDVSLGSPMKKLVKLALSIRSTPESSPQYCLLQSRFALELLQLYEITLHSRSLDVAVDRASRAAEVVIEKNDFPPAATFLIRNWAYSQRLLARKEGCAEPLDPVIEVATTVLSMSSDYYPSDVAGRRFLSMELAECLLDKYRHAGDVKDLNDALCHVAGEEPDDAHSRYVLGSLCLERYTRLNALDDLDKALRHGLNLKLQHLGDGSLLDSTTELSTPLVHPDAAPSMHLLAMSLAQRFAVIMDVDELDKADTYGRRAVELCHPEHPYCAMYLSHLASLLHQRFIADEDSADLEECVDKARASFNAVRPGCYPYYPPQAVLGLALARLGRAKNKLERIEEGIHHLMLARKNFYGGTHLESRIEQDLASALLLKFESTNAKDDLDEAIHYASSALQRAPVEGHSRSALAFELSRMGAIRYSLCNVEDDLKQAIYTLRDVSNGTGPASTRLSAAMQWAKVAIARGPAASLEALKVALNVLPLVAWSGQRMVIRYKTLMSLSTDIGPWAAACAISCGQLDDAVLYLERGRSVIWSQLLAFQGGTHKHRAVVYAEGTSASTTEKDALASYLLQSIHGSSSPMMMQEARDEVKRQHPQIYDVLENLESFINELKCKAASLPVHRPERDQELEEFKASIMGICGDASLRSAACRWSSLQSTVEDLEEENKISCHLFESDSPLAEFLAGGYIVLLNAHSTRCDALIVRRATADTSVHIDHVPLPELSADTAHQWAESLRIGMCDLQEGSMGVRDLENLILVPILQELWRTAASPVLTHLPISDPASPPTRIWWCLSGPLTFLPIHAAGPYDGAAPGVPELIVSSYTPTIKSLLKAYKAPSAPFSMLAVGQPDTPNMSPLPSVRKELATVEQACARVSGDLATLVGPDAAVFAVAQALASHTWLHLSCHAHQDPDYPFNSAFYMHNGPLTLKILMQLDLARVQFAFLSACLTSAGDARLPDECIHLAAGLQFAGVRSAVATLWSVDDRASAFVTDGVYGRLMKEGVTEPDAGEAARALHDVVLARKAAGKAMVFRVPFIHVGI